MIRRPWLAVRALGWLVRSFACGLAVRCGAGDRTRYAWGAAEGLSRVLWLRARGA